MSAAQISVDLRARGYVDAQIYALNHFEEFLPGFNGATRLSPWSGRAHVSSLGHGGPRADSRGLTSGKEQQVKDSGASSEVSDASDTSMGNFKRVTFAADTDRSPASKGKGRGRGRSSA